MQRKMIGIALLAVGATAFAQSPRASMDGYGAARIGMTREALSRALGEPLIDAFPPDGDTFACTYVHPKSNPDGPAYMLIDGRLARIDFGESDGVATVSGARVGMPEADVMRLYAGRVAVEPHHYGEATDHYLTVHSTDGKRGVRFETMSGKVTSYYVGSAEAIQYVEGCL